MLQRVCGYDADAPTLMLMGPAWASSRSFRRTRSGAVPSGMASMSASIFSIFSTRSCFFSGASLRAFFLLSFTRSGICAFSFAFSRRISAFIWAKAARLRSPDASLARWWRQGHKVGVPNTQTSEVTANTHTHARTRSPTTAPGGHQSVGMLWPPGRALGPPQCGLVRASVCAPP